jgi:RNA polymerase-binding transcription factor DksA
VFTYLDDITEWFGDTFGAPFRAVARWLGYAAADTVKTTVDVTAQGAKSAVDIAAGAATSSIDVLQQTIGSTNAHANAHADKRSTNNNHTNNLTDNNNNNERPSESEAETESSSLETALSHAKKKAPQPDDATSRIQRTGKSGYCYIGEDRGFRSCIKVGEQDTCMSGDIFPTHAICINPRLRQ